MELEGKLDEDFLFYLGFTNTFLRRVTDPELYHKARAWIYKLVAEPCEGEQRKRCRNIYLAQLLICLQNGVLDKPFLIPPFDVDITNASEVFAPIPRDIEKPDWLNDTAYDVRDETDTPRHVSVKPGRTYFATRTLPGGQGAFAYIGVSLTDEEPMWLGAGEGHPSFDQQMEEKFNEMVPPVYEMEKILARRKDPKEREKVLTFYDVLLQTIADELDGKDTPEDETVEGLLVQLIHDLTDKGQYGQYEELEEAERRIELLLVLFERVKSRRDKVARREEMLDELEQNIPKSIFDTSELQPEDKYELPAAMWEQAIGKFPQQRQLDRLLAAYPVAVVEKYLNCLANLKEEIASRMQRRHENICSQMKKELRKEGEKKKKCAEEAEAAMENALFVLEAIREQCRKIQAIERANRGGFEDQPKDDNQKIYEQMKLAVFDQQKLVEEEALKGKFLAAQINVVSDQTQMMMNINDGMIRKAEAANMKLMARLRRLNLAIKTYESRIRDIRNTIKEKQKPKGRVVHEMWEII